MSQRARESAVSKVFIVIVTYNGAHCIDRCLQSVVASDNGADELHAVVVDNASTDDTLARVKAVQAAHPGRLTVLPSQYNAGFGVGNNVGMAWALSQGADYLFLLNQDALVEPGTTRELSVFMQAHPAFAAVTPLHMSPDWHHVDPKTYIGYLREGAGEYVKDALAGQVKAHYCIPGINAAAWFLRRQAVETVGGFDPLYFMYGEDDDYLARMAYHRQAFALLPTSRVLHLRESPSTGAKVGFRTELVKHRKRAFSSLLTAAKDPRYGAVHASTQLLVRGVMQPLVDWIIHRNHGEVLGSLSAVLRVISKWPAIQRSRKITSVGGSAYLEMPHDQTIP